MEAASPSSPDVSSSSSDQDLGLSTSDTESDKEPEKKKEEEEEEDNTPALEWPADTKVPVAQAVAFADHTIQSVMDYVRSSSEGLPWEKIKGQDTSRVLPGLRTWAVEHYQASNTCISCRTREVVGKEHADYLTNGVSVCDVMWTAAAHLMYVEESFKDVARKLSKTSSNMFTKRDFEGGEDTHTVRQRYLFSPSTLIPVLQSVIREWNRMDGTFAALETGCNHNRLSWNGERLDMLRLTCAVTTVSQGIFRASSKSSHLEDVDLMRFNHLCARLFYWTDLEDAVFGCRPFAQVAFCDKLYASVGKCRRQFYAWIRAQMQIDLDRGREFGDVFRRTVYSLELGAAAETEYRRMHPTKSDLMISTTEPMHMFMDADTDLHGNTGSSTERYDVLKKYFNAGLAAIAARQDPNEPMGRHPLHQALMLSVVAYFFEQVQRRKFFGRYCYLPQHLPDIYKRRDAFFLPLACKVPPREKLPRIVCTGASVHILFRGYWIPMRGLVDACIAFFVLCKRFHKNELETGTKISPMFLLITLENLEGLDL